MPPVPAKGAAGFPRQHPNTAQGYTDTGVSRTPHGKRVPYPRTRALDLLQIKKRREKREAEWRQGRRGDSDSGTPRPPRARPPTRTTPREAGGFSLYIYRVSANRKGTEMYPQTIICKPIGFSFLILL